MRLYDNFDGEPFLVNPPLALWGATSNPRRRAPKMKRRGRRRARRNPAGLALANPRRRRRRRAYAYNPPRRSKGKARRVSRRRSGARGGSLGINSMLPTVGIGIGAGLLLSYVTPMVARTVGIPEAGMTFRLAQAAVAFGLPWAARSAGLIAGPTATAMASIGLTLTGLGLVRDFQAGGGAGLAGYYRLPAGANRQALQGAPGVSGYPSPLSAVGGYYRIG